MHQAPDLAWSSSLASSAAKAAQEMVNSCSFQHSGTAGVGENLAAGKPASVKAQMQRLRQQMQNDVSQCVPQTSYFAHHGTVPCPPPCTYLRL